MTFGTFAYPTTGGRCWFARFTPSEWPTRFMLCWRPGVYPDHLVVRLFGRDFFMRAR